MTAGEETRVLDEVDQELLQEVERLRAQDEERKKQTDAVAEIDQSLLLSGSEGLDADDDNGQRGDPAEQGESALEPGQEYYTGGLLPNGVRHGKGTLVYGNRFFRYTGEWAHGVKNGHGTLFFGDSGADFYEGQFLDGEITGRGIRQWADGSSYNGEWVWGERCGEGVLLSADGTKYEGAFRANQRHGSGTLTKPNGDVYLGDFRHNRKHGRGTLECVNGDSYDGEFQDGLFHGQGEAAWANGDTYVGSWAFGKREGLGTFVDGVSLLRYEGSWVDDMPAKVPARIHHDLPEPEECAPEADADGQGECEAHEAADDQEGGEGGDDDDDDDEGEASEEQTSMPIPLQGARGQPWSELLCIGIVTAKPKTVTSRNLERALVAEESGRVLELIVDKPEDDAAQGNEDLETTEDDDDEKRKPRVLCRMQVDHGRATIDPSIVVPEGDEDEVDFLPGSIVNLRLQDATQGLRPEERVRPVLLQMTLPKK
ncbi:Phosphatidylinositol 4-phosphate 5-kinase 1 [Hondaea fermentalgiana]|uniref:Phosphatidylinositol 4-phosphate 5-kinase 1 n=1 Tax=Hondaea fermentalgiana TaxID=2315210 RepID=A0A2R5GQ27_9STRA|nr:Phosphatidylinositol 4-phosphate 5-kinase 1 [Hondaea fermentalgiana]|eukprot:GBG32715.1 Phosphatidylinositol 4-phosphate 5-kinase 1 [Hondaea fermentalgiana]